MTAIASALPKDPAVVAIIERERARVRAGKEPFAHHFAEAEAAVRTWTWAKEPLVPRIPLEHELQGGAIKAKSLKTPPENPKNVFAEGFDENGRFVFVKHYDANGRLSVGCAARRGTELRFWHSGKLANITQRDIVQEVAVLDVRPGLRLALNLGEEAACTSTAYVLEGERIVTVVVWSTTWPADRVVVYDTTYDDHGRLIALTHGGQTIWKRVDKPLATLLDDLEDRLLRELPSMIAAAASGPLYCVALGYQELPDELAPPSVGLGLEATRDAARRALAKGDEVEVSELWNPLQFEDGPVPGVFPVEGYSPEALELGKDVALRVLADGAVDKYRKTLAAVAKRLAALDWSKVAKTTEDFVVYPTDYGALDWEAALKKRVDAATWKGWRAEGIV